ncbi:MAG TPA: hypothetical protein VIH37_09885, partial [Candidatus Limnocylindrales bacterium]
MLGVGRWGPLGRDVDPGGGGWPGTVARGMDERDAWVVLAGANGIGPVTFARLLQAFGSAVAVLAAGAGPGAVARLVAASAA